METKFTFKIICYCLYLPETFTAKKNELKRISFDCSTFVTPEEVDLLDNYFLGYKLPIFRVIYLLKNVFSDSFG